MAAIRYCVIIGVVLGLMSWRMAVASFHIEAGDMKLTLNEWSRQSDVQILFDIHLVDGLQSRTVHCECTDKEALTMLLRGSGLVFDYVNERTVAVVGGEVAVAADPDDLRRWLNGFEYVAQTYAENAGPKLPPLTKILPAQDLIAGR